MTKAHEAEGVVLVLSLLHKLLNSGDVTNFVEHVQHGFVSAAVGGPPQRRDARGNAGEGVGPGGAGQAHRGGGRVLLVIGVEREDPVHGAGDHGVNLVILRRVAKHHVQEVLGVAEVVPGIHEGLAKGILVGHGRERGHLGDKPVGRDFPVPCIIDV